MIYYNNFNKLSEVYLGDKQISKAYYGSNLVYPSTSITSNVLFTETPYMPFLSGVTLFKVNTSKSDITALVDILAQKRYNRFETFDYLESELDLSGNTLYGIQFVTDGASGITLGGAFKKFKPVRCNSMFQGTDTQLGTVDVSNIDSSEITACTSMFAGCTGLTSVEFGDEKYPNMVDCDRMFESCSGLTSLTMPHTFDKVTDISTNTFSGCTNITEFHAPNATFSQLTKFSVPWASLVTLDLPSATFDNVTSVTFSKWYKTLKEINLPKAKFDKLTSISDWLGSPNKSADTINLDSATFENVTDGSYAFEFGNTKFTSLSLPSATFNHLTNGKGMFDFGNGLGNLSLSSATFSALTSSSYMFNILPTVYMPKATFDSLTQAKAKNMFSAINKSITINATGQAKLIELNQTSTGIGLPSEWNDTSYSGWIIV